MELNGKCQGVQGAIKRSWTPPYLPNGGNYPRASFDRVVQLIEDLEGVIVRTQDVRIKINLLSLCMTRLWKALAYDQTAFSKTQNFPLTSDKELQASSQMMNGSVLSVPEFKKYGQQAGDVLYKMQQDQKSDVDEQ